LIGAANRAIVRCVRKAGSENQPSVTCVIPLVLPIVDVYKTMTDLAFLEAKCTHVDVTTTGTGEEASTMYGGVYDLLEDYRLALERYPEDPAADVQAGENA
jgi:hypothetical protein